MPKNINEQDEDFDLEDDVVEDSEDEIEDDAETEDEDDDFFNFDDDDDDGDDDDDDLGLDDDDDDDGEDDDDDDIEPLGESKKKSKPFMIQSMRKKMDGMDEKQLSACYSKIMSSMNPAKDKKEKKELDETIKKSKPKSRAAMIQSMVDTANSMKKEKLASSYKKIMSSFDTNDGDEDEEKSGDENMKKGKGKDKMKKEMVKKIKKEDLDVAEDIKAVFAGKRLSKKFMENATTVFEAAVVSMVNEKLEDAAQAFDEELEREKIAIAESMQDHIDNYTNFVVANWVKENKLVIEQGIRGDISENFMIGLKKLFNENNIEIPEDRVDIAEELSESVISLENRVNIEMERNMELQAELDKANGKAVLRDVCEGLSYAQTDKMESLAEGVGFEDESQYQSELETIKENYFGEQSSSSDDDVSLDDEPFDDAIDLAEENSIRDPQMQIFTDAISRTT